MLKTIPEIVAQARASLKEVTAEQAIVQCKESNGLILDVREPEEFAKKSAKGSLNIPRGLIEMKMLKMYPDAELAIFIHCATGARAALAGEQLKRVGYQNVSVISGDLDGICNAFC